MFRTRMNRLQQLLLVIFLPLTAVVWLFQLNPAASAASATSTLDVVVSEIAWMGTTGSVNDEWLELANNTAGVFLHIPQKSVFQHWVTTFPC